MRGSSRVGGWLAPVATGFALGAGWGVLARVWMRLVSTAPSFSWTGTMLIVGFAALAGALLGLVHAARVHRRGRLWRLAALPGLVLFMGQGLPLLPSLVLGGWAWSGRGPVALRVLAAVPLLVVPVLLWQSMPRIDQLLLEPVSAIGGFIVLEVALAAAGAVWFRRWPARSRQQVVAAPALA